MKTIDVLIIEDHKTMIDGYKKIIRELKTFDFNFLAANDCDKSAELILDKKLKIDIVLLDIQIPGSERYGLRSGENLIEFLKIERPATKILVLTSHIEGVYLYKLAKLGANGILVKSDFGGQDLKLGVVRILNDETDVFSETVISAISHVKDKDLYLDDYNRQILLLLNKGVKTKSLPEYLNLSLSAIDKRKAQIKEYLKVGKGSDEEILDAARKRGLV